MLLWSIQTEENYDILMRDGVYRTEENDREFILSTDGVLDKYDWLSGQMSRRVGLPETGIAYPVWAWHTYGGLRKRPDIRSIRWIWGSRPGIRYVMMEIDAPEKEVLLSDLDLWTCVMNGWYIPVNGREKCGGKPPEEIRESWNRIFDIGLCSRCVTDYGYIQANIWEIKKEWITGTKRFTSAMNKEDRRILSRQQRSVDGKAERL